MSNIVPPEDNAKLVAIIIQKMITILELNATPIQAFKIVLSSREVEERFYSLYPTPPNGTPYIKTILSYLDEKDSLPVLDWLKLVGIFSEYDMHVIISSIDSGNMSHGLKRLFAEYVFAYNL